MASWQLVLVLLNLKGRGPGHSLRTRSESSGLVWYDVQIEELFGAFEKKLMDEVSIDRYPHSHTHKRAH